MGEEDKEDYSINEECEAEINFSLAHPVVCSPQVLETGQWE